MTKKQLAYLLTFVVLAISAYVTVPTITPYAETKTYDEVVLRGSHEPPDWNSNNHQLSYDESDDVWQSEPIPLSGGKELEFKYVMNGEWLEGNNLTFTPSQSGDYVFSFHPDDERTVDVQISNEYDGKLTLNLNVPGNIPEWVVPTVASDLNNFNYEVTQLDKVSDQTYEIKLAGEAGTQLEYIYALGAEQYQEVREDKRQATFTEDNQIYQDTVETWEQTPVVKNVTHDDQRQPFIPDENDAVTINTTVKGSADSGAIYYTTDGATPNGTRGESNTNIAKFEVVSTESTEDGKVTKLQGTIPKQENGTRVKYKLDIWNDDNENTQFADNNIHESENATEFAYYVDDYQSPDWAKNAVIYQVFVDRFSDGNPNNNKQGVENLPYDEQLKDWMGGDLQGLKDKLDYIKDIGANTIWISPIYEGPYSHGYHPADFKDIDDRFGDEDTLKSLIDKAHNMGLKVVYDFVPNHSSNKHPFFQDALANGESSPYYDWYSFTDWPNEYETFYGINELPKLNYDNQATRDYMINDVAPYWLAELGFDGFRLDHANGPSDSFWVDFRDKVKQVNEDAFIFGEVWEDTDTIRSYAGKLDGAIDFGMNGALKNVFAKDQSMTNLNDAVQSNQQAYPDEYVMTSFLDSHDVPRFLFEADGDTDKLKLAAATHFTLPGTPIMYYGTEVGLSQSKDHNSVSDWKDRYYREPMIWDETEQDQDLKAFYQQLTSLYNDEPALRTGNFKNIYVNDDVYLFERYNNSKKFIVAVNKGEKQVIPLHEFYKKPLKGAKLKDAWDSKTQVKATTGKLNLTLKENSVTIYQANGALKNNTPLVE